MRKAANRVRVTAQLIDAETGHHVWAERYDRELEDIFALQDELTQGIAAVVAPELDRAEHRRLVVTRPRDLGAWDLVLQGMTCLTEFSEASNQHARDSFEHAVALGPLPGSPSPTTGKSCWGSARTGKTLCPTCLTTPDARCSSTTRIISDIGSWDLATCWRENTIWVFPNRYDPWS